MMLCFGTYAKVLKLCKRSDVSDKILVGTLISTVDPDSEYINSDNSTISRLINCGQNLSNGNKRRIGQTREDGIFTQGHETNRLSDIVNLANTADVNVVAQKIQEDFLPLLDADKMKLVVPAVFRIIAEDETIDRERSETFQRWTGAMKSDYLKRNSVCLSVVLSQLFLYTVVIGDNRKGKECVSVIDQFFVDDSCKRFSRITVYTEVMYDAAFEKIIADESGRNKIRQYLCRGMDKIKQVKTMIFGDRLVDYSPFYVCNDIAYEKSWLIKSEEDERYELIENATPEKIKHISKYVIFQGVGGVGKTMMLRHLFCCAAEEYESSGRIPIFIPIRDFGIVTEDLEDLVFYCFERFDTGFSKEFLSSLLRAGSCILLMDGLDEVNDRYFSAFNRELERLTDKYPENLFILSSRPFDNFVPYSRFAVMEIEPLTYEQAYELVEKIDFRPDDPSIKQRFLEQFDDLYSEHVDFVEIPLLLTIMLITFEEYAEIPSKMNQFYEEAFDTLFSKHDANKGVYKRKLKSGLSKQAIKRYFSEFCAKTYYEHVYSFNEAKFEKYYDNLRERIKDDDQTEPENFLYDMSVNLCMLYHEGREYSFMHRSFQEYFCALYFSKQNHDLLPEIGDFFEGIVMFMSRDNKCFDMLYEMIPDAVERMIFLPHLEKLYQKCCSENGYWTFVDELYPTIQLGVGHLPFRIQNLATSFLYCNMRKRFFPESCVCTGIPLDRGYVFRTYGYFAEEYDNQTAPEHELVCFEDIPEEESKLLGPFKEEGWIMQVEIYCLMRDREESADLVAAMEDDSFLLKREYKAFIKYYAMLKERMIPRGSDLFDKFV